MYSSICALARARNTKAIELRIHPAGSLKELISNSYDSDAERVTVEIADDEVSIRDNGSGMDWQDFDREFTFISYSTKRLESNTSKVHKRPIIGFIGIGFIAVSELCDVLEIKSCKKDSELLFEAKIDFSKFRKPEMAQREFYEISEYELINYKKKDKGVAVSDSFTEIKLKNLRPGFKEIILDKAPFDRKLVSIEDIWEFVSTRGTGITGLGKYWQMILNLAIVCPVRYSAKGPVQGASDKMVSEIKANLESYSFRVTINEIELVKPVIFPNDAEIAKSREYAIHPISGKMQTPEGVLSFKGYMYSQHGMINPKECMGVLIRIKNVAIGGYDRTFLEYPSGSNQLFRNWLSGEIYVEEGLENAMNINRSSFKITNADYIALRGWLHSFLNEEIFKYTYEKYYLGGRKERQKEKEAEQKQIFDRIIKSELGSKYEFKYSSLPERKSVLIDRERKTVIMNAAYPVLRRTPARFENLLQRIFVLFEIALEKSHGDIQELERIFKEEIEKWINE
jgi:hypothetical protein